MKIVEFRIGKGKTVRPGDAEQWNRKYLELTIRLPEKYTEEDFHVALTRAEYLIDQDLEAPEVAAIPRLDIADVDALSWKKRNKEPAEPGEFAWLFGPGSRGGTEQGAEGLVKAIQATTDGKLALGDMEYSIVKDGAFVQRKPVKKD